MVRAGRVKVERHVNTKLQRFETSTLLVQTQICAGCMCTAVHAGTQWVVNCCIQYVCVTNCVFAYCGPLGCTCLCNTWWCTSVEQCDTPGYTAAGCRRDASDVAAMSHSGQLWRPHCLEETGTIDIDKDNFPLGVYMPADPPSITSRSVLDMTCSQPGISVDGAGSERAAWKSGVPIPRIRGDGLWGSWDPGQILMSLYRSFIVFDQLLIFRVLFFNSSNFRTNSTFCAFRSSFLSLEN